MQRNRGTIAAPSLSPSRSQLAFLTLAFLSLACLLLPSLSLAQKGGSDEPTFGEVVDVRVVNLEVVVTHKGERVRGLAAEDFSLFIDGQEMPIDYFTEVRDGWAVDSATAVEGVSAQPALEPGSPVGTRYLIFVDDYFSLPNYRNRVLSKLRQQLPALGPGDQVAVVAFDGRQVEMLTSWTSSPRELDSALAEAADRPAFGLHRLAEERRFGSQLRVNNGGFASSARTISGIGGPFLDSVQLHRAKQIASQVEKVVSAATASLRGFAQPEGRKVMLLLSGGWPSVPEAWVAGSFVQARNYSGLAGGRSQLEPLVSTANRLGYTLYPVDVNGNERRGRGSAEFRSVQAAALQENLDFERERINEDSLFHLARRTGGKALVDGASLAALERVVADTRTYYWLGFAPTWQGDDSRHRVEIRTRVKGAKVRSRRDYSDLSTAQQVSMMVESAHLFDAPLPGDSGMRVAFGEARSAGFGKMLVPVALSIPLDQVTLLPGSSGYLARLELRVAAMEGDGDQAEIPIVPIEIGGLDKPAAGEVAVYETLLRLRKKPHRLLLSIYDPPTGNVLSRKVELSL